MFHALRTSLRCFFVLVVQHLRVMVKADIRRMEYVSFWAEFGTFALLQLVVHEPCTIEAVSLLFF